MKKLLITLALFAAVPAFSATPCTISGLPKISGLDYHTARAALIKAGFTPLTTRYPMDIGVTSEYPQSLGYTEVESCTGSGIPLCAFRWRTRTMRDFYTITSDAENGLTFLRTTCD